MIRFQSTHADLLAGYIQHKRSLGFKFNYDYSFAQFDRFLLENNYTNISLDKEICRKWEEKRPNETDANRYQRVGLVHNYAVYLQKLGYETCVPEHFYNFRSDFAPYIFSRAEIMSFFKACDSTQDRLQSPAYPAFFRLVYGCGLRCSEAVGLKIKDYDMEAMTIIVRESKNKTERILPVSKSLKVVLDAYVYKYRNSAGPEETLFVTRHNSSLSHNAIYTRFRQILEASGISHGGRGKGPRIHDLRHSFSVHTLAEIAESGKDIYVFLPYLSKYLGHKSIEATEGYVRLTSELYPSLMERVNSYCSYIYPEVNDDESQ